VVKLNIWIMAAIASLFSAIGIVYAQESHPVKLSGIVVTATRTEKELADVPASTSLVTKEDIEMSNVQAVDQALDALPGVFDRRGKGLMDTQSAVTLRGMPEQKRTLIMLDGITMNKAYDGTVNFGGFAPEDVEKIEVVRGPFSSLYGGYAMGGVVNIITKMPEKREVAVKGGYGTDNTWGTYTSYGDKFKDKFRFFMSYSYKSTDGYVTDYNVQTAKPPAGISGWSPQRYYRGASRYPTVYLIGDKGNNWWYNKGLTVKAGYDFTRTSKLLLSYMRNESEYMYRDPNTYVMNAANVPVYTYGTVRESSFLGTPGGTTQNIYNASYETEFSSVKAKASVNLNELQKSWYVTPGTTAATTFSGGPGTVSSSPSRAYSTDLQFVIPAFKIHTLIVGGSYRYAWSDTEERTVPNWNNEVSTTNLTYQSRGKDRTFALFVQDEIALRDNLTAYLGLRQDRWKTFDGYANSAGFAGYPQHYGPSDSSSISPKGALVYTPFKETTLRTSVGKAFRPPTLYELYRTWTSTSGITYAGNPNLKPEKSLSWDISAEQKLWEGFQFKGAYFETYIDDLIYSRTLTPILQDKINAGKADIKGFEIEGSQKFDVGIVVFANYTYNNAKMRDNDIKPATEGKRLTYVPGEMFNIGFDVERGPSKAHCVGRYVGKRYSDDTNIDRVNGVYLSYDPYFVADAKVSYAVTKFATVSLAVDNVFNKDYFSSYQAPGRKWYGEMTLKF